MKVQILTTPDCSNCSVLEDMLEKLNVTYDLIDVTQKPEYLQKYPIFTAPGLVINEKLMHLQVFLKLMNYKKDFLINR